MKSKLLTLIVMAVSFQFCQAQNNDAMNTLDSSTVSAFDLEQYLGTWYEIARYPHRFEKDLQGVTATYSIRKDGKIKVLNQGYKGSLDGKKSRAVGKAKLNKNGKPGQLKVSFFLFFYADYFVMELDPNYQWALVGSSSPNFLWVLSRTPELPKETVDHILSKAKSRGYDLSELEFVKHK